MRVEKSIKRIHSFFRRWRRILRSILKITERFLHFGFGRSDCFQQTNFEKRSFVGPNIDLKKVRKKCRSFLFLF
ncbi:hypothetical protein DLM75_07025 [Leptospira stimsonii]|uniref:Uncharacterized protein n=1 Tax=Leptospira stimsonii TaxID=2202203 RepID=A0A396ZIA4_9LEPT|nr:hypothetical protein DLM75_07025 [Leptospira stimsonii]